MRVRRGLRARFGILTTPGRGRPLNEDWCDALEPGDAEEGGEDGWLWVLADGVGTPGTGREASQAAGEAIVQAYRQGDRSDALGRLRQAVEAGNRAVRQRRRAYVRQGQDRPVLTTALVAALIGERLLLANVGDCRAYLVRGGRIEQLTRDHTRAAEYVARGLLRPEQLRDHPQLHVLTRSLGQRDTVEVDLQELTLEAGDRLVLCSDGLTRHLEDHEILRLAGGAPDAAARALLDQAVDRGGEDDITVVVVEALPPADLPAPVATPLPAGVAASREHLATLHEIGQRISASLDLTETLGSVVESVVEVTGAERGFVMLWDETTGELIYQIDRKLPVTDRKVPEFSRSIVQSVFDSGRPIRIGDAQADERVNRSESVVIGDLRSVLCAPLQVKDKSIGVVYVENRLGAELFSDADLELLCTFAGQAAIALDNARLHDELKRRMAENAALRASHENVLRSINSAIISVDGIGRVLTFNRAAEELFGVSAGDARLRQVRDVVPEPIGKLLAAVGVGTVERGGQGLDDVQVGATRAASAGGRDTSRTGLQVEIELGERGRATLSVRILPLADDANRPIGAVIIVEDITQHIRLGVLGRYLPPLVVEQLMADPRGVRLGGKRQEVTVLFADIRGFSSLAERHPPEEVVSLLNSYLACATEVILEAGGTLDKFLGDGVMAFFNAPLPQDHHILAATRAAVRMQARLAELQGTGPKRLGFGVGINTGESIVGNIGTADLMNYTVIGDAVNVAARLQGEARRGEVLLSGSSHAQVADKVKVEELGSIHVKGRAEPVPVYKVLRILD